MASYSHSYGYSISIVVLQEDLSRTARRIPNLLAGASCSGTEDSLADCAGPEISLGENTEKCGLSDVISLVCVVDTEAGTPWPCIRVSEMHHNWYYLLVAA